MVALKGEVKASITTATNQHQDLNNMIFGSGGLTDSLEKHIDRLTQQVSGNGVEVGDC